MSGLRQASWYISAFLKKHRKILVISTLSSIALFLVLSQVSRFIPVVKRTTYIGRVGRFSLSQIPRDIQEKVSFGLTKVSENGEVGPALASSYISEEGGKSYRFTIHPQMHWQDGKQVTPEDVNYSFSDVQTARSPNDIVYRLIAKKQDEAAQEPVLPVSFLNIVSQPLFRQLETRNLFFQRKVKLIGLGKYQITSLIDQGSGIRELTLDSTTERLVYRFYPTDHNAVIAFKRGEVDRLEEILDPEDLKDIGGMKLESVLHHDQYAGVFFNLAYKNGEDLVYANKPLRQALNLSLRKPAVNRIFSPISRVSWAYVRDEGDLDAFDQNVNQAVALLVKAETPTPLTIQLQTTPTYADMADDIKADWEELGRLSSDACKLSKDAVASQCDNKKISVDVRITSFPDTSNYQVMLVGQQIPKDPDQYYLWHSTQPTNITRYKNAKVDKLLEDGRRSQSITERKLMYQEFQQILVKDTPVIFLNSITTFNISRALKFF